MNSQKNLVFIKCFHLQILNGFIAPMGVTQIYIALSVLFCQGVTYGRNVCSIYTNIYGQRSCDFITIYTLSNLWSFFTVFLGDVERVEIIYNLRVVHILSFVVDRKFSLCSLIFDSPMNGAQHRYITFILQNQTVYQNQLHVLKFR